MEERFLEYLKGVSWFSNLGNPVSVHAPVKQIFNWSDWPGPGDEFVMEIHNRHQYLYEKIFKFGKEKGIFDLVEDLWKKIYDLVVRVASATSAKVPFDPSKDSWHGPRAKASNLFQSFCSSQDCRKKIRV